MTATDFDASITVVCVVILAVLLLVGVAGIISLLRMR